MSCSAHDLPMHPMEVMQHVVPHIEKGNESSILRILEGVPLGGSPGWPPSLIRNKDTCHFWLWG
jgi:hypothetical protein